MSREEKINTFDPNAPGLSNNQLYGLPFNFEESELIILPVPWEVTVSFNAGTAKGPAAILEASYQVDLHDLDHPEAWKKGIFMLDVSQDLLEKSNHYRLLSREIIQIQEKGGNIDDNPTLKSNRNDINDACNEMNKWVFEQASTILNRGKKVGMIGGDHSTALGMIQAMSKRHTDFGVLQFDAHADLRASFESFTYSHASIMHHVLKLEQVSKLVQVGTRDVCEFEKHMIDGSSDRIDSYTDGEMNDRLFDGDNWSNICEGIIESLPEKVYISFDIDCLDPGLCPNTGTPVPGGLDFNRTAHLLKMLARSGKEIIGFDLCEVGNDPWDGNVGARLLYKLCGLMLN